MLYRIALLTVCIAVALSAGGHVESAPVKKWKAGRLKLVSKQLLDAPSPLDGAYYVTRTGLEMVGLKGRSMDNGRTWKPFKPAPDPKAGLPANYKRDLFLGWVDPVNGLLLQLMFAVDIEIDPTAIEPPIALLHYYLRYRVSSDRGATFLPDERLVQKGHTSENPFPRVWTGKNGYFLGDSGSMPIRTHKGNVLIPAQACYLGPSGKMESPGGGFTYMDVLIIIGKWKKDKHIEWHASSFIEGDPAKSTRGMFEPTLAEMPDGRILCVMRGSNGGEKDPEHKIPAYRWYSVSADGGFQWSKPEPMRYDTGEAFFSPSSMSRLLVHSNGRVYWIGNISDMQCQGNSPRYPLYIAEVDPKSLALVRSTLTVIDNLQPGDAEGINLSHVFAIEDRQTHEIVMSMYRYNQAYTKGKPVVYRVGVN